MKWTRETVAAVNWKAKSTLETLDACVEHHQEQMGEGAWLYADTCPACQKWSKPDSRGTLGIYGNCGECPLQPFCCDGLWQKWQGASIVRCNGVSEREVFQRAMLNFIIHKRDEERERERLLTLANAKAKCKAEPEYEWVDCTKEFFPQAQVMEPGEWYCFHSGGQNRVYLVPHIDVGYDADTTRVVQNCLYFRIERRVEKKEKKREFKVGDIVKDEDGEIYTVRGIGHDGSIELGVLNFARYASASEITLVEAAK